MFKNILVVCVGNICRSPTVEYLFKQKLNELGKPVSVQSAGLGALAGKPAAEPAQQVAKKHGIDLSPHIARQLTSDMIHKHDLILVMEENHIKGCERITPAARGKTHLLGRWNNDIEIPDPYRKGEPAYELAFELIEESTQQWITRIFS